MINSYEEYMQRLLEIQNSTSVIYSSLPVDKPKFIIDTKTRLITIPSEFSFLAVLKDHKAETMYFEIDRYFDGEDLSTHTCVVQFELYKEEENEDGEITETILYHDVCPVVDIDITTVEGKIIFGWTLTNDVTQFASNIRFSVRFYSTEEVDNTVVFSYSFNTLWSVSQILDTLDISESSSTEIIPSELQIYLDKMEELHLESLSVLESAQEIVNNTATTEEIINYIEGGN